MNHISSMEGSDVAYCGGWASPNESQKDQLEFASCDHCITTYKENLRMREGTLGEVIDERVSVYGDPTKTFVRIAEVWTGILGKHVTATDVPLMLIGMKLVRTQVTPDYSDNSDDVEGYLDIFRQLVGEDMIHARSVQEYLDKRGTSRQAP